MSIFLATLGDPIWQIGGGIILLLALVLLLALRSPEVHLSPWHHWLCLDPRHAAGLLLTVPRAQRGSDLVPWRDCLFLRRAFRVAALSSNRFASWRVFALADSLAFTLAEAVSPAHSRAWAGAHHVLRCHHPAGSQYRLGTVRAGPAKGASSATAAVDSHHDHPLPGGSGE